LAELDVYRTAAFHDPVSSLSHLLGAAVFAVLGLFLLRRGRGDAGRIAFLGVFAAAGVLLLSISGVYHLLSAGGAGRAVLQRLDHAAIFVLIAGTFTPLYGILFAGPWRWGGLALVWSAAAAGVCLKTVFFADLSEALGVTFYLAFGWFGAFSGLVLWRRYGLDFVKPLIAGGVAYTAGAVLEFLRRPVLLPGVVGPHELFHLFVLAGAFLHWRFVWQFASGEAPPQRGRRTALTGP
jgi:channel protein (hemolysin III family)